MHQPNQSYQPLQPNQMKTAEVIQPKWTTVKLILGIISMFLFILVTFQSCAVGLSNTLSESKDRKFIIRAASASLRWIRPNPPFSARISRCSFRTTPAEM